MYLTLTTDQTHVAEQTCDAESTGNQMEQWLIIFNLLENASVASVNIHDLDVAASRIESIARMNHTPVVLLHCQHAVLVFSFSACRTIPSKQSQ